MTKTKAAQLNRAKARDKEAMRGVEVLAFHEIEAYTSSGRYHAFGVFRARGILRVRKITSDFTIRVPQTSRDLWLWSSPQASQQLTAEGIESAEEAESRNAREIYRRWDGLPDDLAALIAEVAHV